MPFMNSRYLVFICFIHLTFNRKREINQALKPLKTEYKEVHSIFVAGLGLYWFFMYTFFKDFIETLNNFLQLNRNCKNTTPLK